ncbi:hypothetical protein VNO77_07078 [Canavalia gladiata]|uniref:Uncharacterized protein n=1 Tax=Canavalia gladiata TaxID=3824 RepID=A0AAN9QVZ2_CANGL
MTDERREAEKGCPEPTLLQQCKLVVLKCKQLKKLDLASITGNWNLYYFKGLLKNQRLDPAGERPKVVGVDGN